MLDPSQPSKRVILKALALALGSVSIFKSSLAQAEVRQECNVGSIDFGALIGTSVSELQTLAGNLFVDLDVSAEGHAVAYRVTDVDADSSQSVTIDAMLNGANQGTIFTYRCDHCQDVRSGWCVTTEPRESPCTYFIAGQSGSPESVKGTVDQDILVTVEKYTKGILFKLGFANQTKKDASESFRNKVVEFLIEHPSLDKAEVEVTAGNHFRIFLPAHP